MRSRTGSWVTFQCFTLCDLKVVNWSQACLQWLSQNCERAHHNLVTLQYFERLNFCTASFCSKKDSHNGQWTHLRMFGGVIGTWHHIVDGAYFSERRKWSASIATPVTDLYSKPLHNTTLLLAHLWYITMPLYHYNTLPQKYLKTDWKTSCHKDNTFIENS